jgi:hypothetical protein
MSAETASDTSPPASAHRAPTHVGAGGDHESVKQDASVSDEVRATISLAIRARYEGLEFITFRTPMGG